MKALELLEHLKNGATLISRWKPRRFGNPKYEYILTMPDGAIQRLQQSTVDALIAHKQIHSVDYGRAIVTYQLGAYIFPEGGENIII